MLQFMGHLTHSKTSHCRYPGTLQITVKGIRPISQQSPECMKRPMNVLQEDKLDHLQNLDVQSTSHASIQLPNLITSFDEHHHSTDQWEDLRNQWRRLPGQVLKINILSIAGCHLFFF